jgi:hypothetical protein
MVWFNLAQNRGKWLAPVNVVMNLQVPLKKLVGHGPISFRIKTLCCM